MQGKRRRIRRIFRKKSAPHCDFLSQREAAQKDQGSRETTAQDADRFSLRIQSTSVSRPIYPQRTTADNYCTCLRKLHGELVCCLTLFFGSIPAAHNSYPRSSLKKRKFSFHIKSTGGIRKISQRPGISPLFRRQNSFIKRLRISQKRVPIGRGIKNKPFQLLLRKLFPLPPRFYPRLKAKTRRAKAFQKWLPSLRLPAPNPCCSQSQ